MFLQLNLQRHEVKHDLLLCHLPPREACIALCPITFRASNQRDKFHSKTNCHVRRPGYQWPPRLGLNFGNARLSAWHCGQWPLLEYAHLGHTHSERQNCNTPSPFGPAQHENPGMGEALLHDSALPQSVNADSTLVLHLPMLSLGGGCANALSAALPPQTLTPASS